MVKVRFPYELPRDIFVASYMQAEIGASHVKACVINQEINGGVQTGEIVLEGEIYTATFETSSMSGYDFWRLDGRKQLQQF